MALERCEYSKITVPNDRGYTDAVLQYVQTVAEKIGFTHRDVEALASEVKRVISIIWEFSFEPGEEGTVEIICERIPRGFKIALRDKGAPFDKEVIQRLIPGGINGSKERTDDIFFHNLGAQGKEIVLVKRLENKDITDYYDACELGPYTKPPQSTPEILAPQRFDVRQITPEDAIEVSKCIYKTYGYTYPHDYVYYPEKLMELNERGRIHSAVAVAENGKIAGHCALQYGEKSASMAELSQGVVIPEFRGMGCFNRLTDYLVKRAAADGLFGIYSQSVTNHTGSQKEGHRFGFRDCGITLGVIPLSLEFKTMLAPRGSRISVLLQYRQLKAWDRPPVFLPAHHREMILNIYRYLGLETDLKDAPPESPTDASAEFKTDVSSNMRYARILVKKQGGHLIRDIETKVRALCLEKTEVIHLLLDLADPGTAKTAKRIENLGFFFAGILPGGAGVGDALILQYLNNVAIRYEEVQVESEMAKKLMDYVGSKDPNRFHEIVGNDSS